jgi:hypothetical protein
MVVAMAEPHDIPYVMATEAGALSGVSDTWVRRLIEGDVLLPTFQTSTGIRSYNRAAVLELRRMREASWLKSATQPRAYGNVPGGSPRGMSQETAMSAKSTTQTGGRADAERR